MRAKSFFIGAVLAGLLTGCGVEELSPEEYAQAKAQAEKQAESQAKEQRLKDVTVSNESPEGLLSCWNCLCDDLGRCICVRTSC